MKLLVVGDVNSTYFIHFIDSLKKYDASVEIDLVNTNFKIKSSEISKRWPEYYNKIISYFYDIPYFNEIPIVRGIIRIFLQFISKNKIKQSKYDVVCFHALFPMHCEIIDWLPSTNNFIVGVVWGSDFYKRKEFNSELRFQNAANKCDLICISTPTFQEDIMTATGLEASKFRQCIFGTKTLELLFDDTSSISQAKQILSFDPDEIIVTCGHNSSPNQQHLDIIKQLLIIKNNIPQNVTFFFPLTYGGSEQYISEVKDVLAQSGLRYKLIDQFLSEKEIISIRKATDIFIQVQKTDAYSASMQEHLFCGNIVITGNWLPYKSLHDKGIYFLSIPSLEKLGESLQETCTNLDILKAKAKQINSPEKFESSLWRVSIKDWHMMLSEYKTKNKNQ